MIRNSLFVFLGVMIISACAPLSNSTLEMSAELEKQLYIMEEDQIFLINQLHAESRRTLQTWLDSTWYPTWMHHYCENEGMKADLEKIPDLEEEERKYFINGIVREAHKEYAKKQTSLMAPLDSIRMQLIDATRTRFNMTHKLKSEMLESRKCDVKYARLKIITECLSIVPPIKGVAGVLANYVISSTSSSIEALTTTK